MGLDYSSVVWVQSYGKYDSTKRLIIDRSPQQQGLTSVKQVVSDVLQPQPVVHCLSGLTLSKMLVL